MKSSHLKMTDFGTANSLDLSAKDIYKTYKSDKIKNANIIIDLLKELEEDDVKKLRKALAVIHRIFGQLIKDGDIKKEAPMQRENRNCPIRKYNVWLFERYTEVHQQLLNIMLNEKFPVALREICILIIIKLIQKETNFPASNESFHNIHFPLGRLNQLYRSLLLSEATSAPFIKKLKEYLQSPDFLLVSLHVLSQIVSDVKEKGPPAPIFLKNLMCFLELIRLPEEGKKSLDPPVLFTSSETDKVSGEEEVASTFNFPHKKARKLFNIIWEAVLNLEFDSSTYKRCLVLLPEKVMMHLDQPVRLTDFFMNAYYLGGVISVLALHGMYILITQHNLENPDFYDKLYALFEATIFHVKYKARFFMLCNKFFRSPYLPEYIISAFIKRSCRLMLTAPSCCLVLLVKFVVNLLFKYPSLKRLVDNPNATSVDDDPFVADEPSPKLCRAGESSLWEVAALRQHPLPGVSKAACFIFKNLPDVEHDLSQHVETTYEKMYERASKFKAPRIATTFYKPEGLFKYTDDTMSPCWEIF